MSFANEIADVEGLKKVFDGLDNSLNKNATDLLNLIKVYESLNKAMQGGAQTAENLGKAQKSVSDTQKQQDLINKQIITTTEKLTAVENGSIKPLIEKKIALQAATKALTDEVKAEGLAETSLVRMRQKLSELTAQYDKAGVRTKEAAKEINSLSREIGHAEEATNRHQRGVGGYADQLGTLSKGLVNGTVTFAQFGAGVAQAGKAMLAFFLTPVGMVIGAIGGLVLAGKALISNAKEFQRAASELSALTGAVGDDLDFMKKKAIEFSKESTISAAEVVRAFTRVGSAAPYLLKHKELLTEVTESSIILSEATQGKLSLEDAALATTAALNQFNIPLTDSNRAINALAAGSLLGSVRVNDLTESFRNGGAMMNASNMTLEQSIAALELFGEKNIKGSNAGTMLKTVLMNLRAAGLGFASGQFQINDALDETKKKLESIKDPMERASAEQELFGKRGITGGLILMANTERFKNLSTEITNYVKVGTIARDQAKVQEDNLTGSYEKLSNAWHGLMLMAEDGNGIMMKFWKGLVDAGAWALRDIGMKIEMLGKVLDFFRSKESIAAREEKKAAEDKSVADKVAADKAVKLAEDKAAMDEAIRTKKTEDEEKAAAKAQKLREKQFQVIEAFNTHEQNIAKERYVKRLDSEEVYNNKMIVLELEILQKKLAIYKVGSKEYEDIQSQIYDKSIKARADILKDIKIHFTIKNSAEIDAENASRKRAEEAIKGGLKSSKDYLSAKLKAAKEELKQEEEIAKERSNLEKDLLETKREFTQQAVSTIFSINEGANNKKLEQLDAEKNKLLSNEKLTKDQRAKIEDEYQKKEDAIKRKQKIANKIESAIEVGIKTAQTIFQIQAAAAVLMSNPLTIALAPMALAQIPWVLGMSALSLAAIAKFKHGTLDAPRSGIFGEAGRELMFPVGGGAIMADKPTYFEGSKFKGAKILSNPETERMMGMVADRNIVVKNQTDDRLLNEMKEVKNAIINKKEWIMDSDHRIIGQKTSNHQEIYLNRLVNRN